MSDGPGMVALDGGAHGRQCARSGATPRHCRVPGAPRMMISALMMPFSASPMRATGRFTKEREPRVIAEPSSNTHERCTPRDASVRASTGSAFFAVCFFIAAEGEVDGSGRRESFRQEPFNRLHQSDEAALVVESAPAPDKAVRAVSGKARMRARRIHHREEPHRSGHRKGGCFVPAG